MILWTILPEEAIFGNGDASPIYEEIEYKGVKCLAEKIDSTQYKVIKLLTTNPNDYLLAEWQPGVILTYEPTLKSLS